MYLHHDYDHISDLYISLINAVDYATVCTDIFRMGKKLDKQFYVGKTKLNNSVCVVLKTKNTNKINSIWVTNLSEICYKQNISKSLHFYSCSYVLCNQYQSSNVNPLKVKIACVVHVGNIKVYDESIRQYLQNIAETQYDITYFYTFYNENYKDQIKIIPGCKTNLIHVENRGMDIGPFLKVLSEWKKNENQYDIVFKIHTKTNDSWRKQLCDCLFGDIKTIKKIVWIFLHVPKIGLIGSKQYLLNLDSLNSNTQLSYCKRMKWDITMLNKSKFIGGTIFCMKFECIRKLMTSVSSFQNIINEFKTGYIINSTETNTHAWERLLGIVVHIKNMDYYGQ